MKHKQWALIAAAAALPLFFPGEAEARHCKEYSKTIRIDGVLEVGVGQACERGDGDWEIVSLKGPYEIQDRLRYDIYDDLYDNGYRVVIVNNYGHPHYYHRARYVDYYRPRPALFGFYYSSRDGDHYQDHGHKKHYKRHHRDHDDDHGHRGHGRGHRGHH